MISSPKFERRWRKSPTISSVKRSSKFEHSSAKWTSGTTSVSRQFSFQLQLSFYRRRVQKLRKKRRRKVMHADWRCSIFRAYVAYCCRCRTQRGVLCQSVGHTTGELCKNGWTDPLAGKDVDSCAWAQDGRPDPNGKGRFCVAPPDDCLHSTDAGEAAVHLPSAHVGRVHSNCCVRVRDGDWRLRIWPVDYFARCLTL